MHPVAKYSALTRYIRGQSCALELVPRLKLADGSAQEVTHLREVVVKKAKRVGNKTQLTVADVDLEALDRVFPFETFTVIDFPEIFVDHVGRRVPQGVGTNLRVPLTWISKSGGQWVYAATKVLPAGAGNVLAVYRGTESGRGAVVDPSEYTVSVVTMRSMGVQLVTVVFTKEQIDDQGRPYVLEADMFHPGSRIPSDEISRLMQAYGVLPGAASFAAAAAYDAGTLFRVDPLYGGDNNGRTGRAIIQDHLFVARGWLVPSATPGTWDLAQDRPQASVLTLDTSIHQDQVAIEDYGDGDTHKTISLKYRPLSSAGDQFTSPLFRKGPGPSGELAFSNRYVYDHTCADSLLSYWQRREEGLSPSGLQVAKASVHAAQLNNGSRITINDTVSWNGANDFLISGVTRPGDRNALTLREYNPNAHVYRAPGANDAPLPADATNGYSPDFSFTKPAAPAPVTIPDQGATVTADGTLTSFVRIRAVPPATNWKRLMCAVTNDVSGEIVQGELLFDGVNYETRITGLHPNVAHTAIVWAVNANNVNGNATTVGFTSTTVSTSPAVPTGLTYVSGQATTDANGVVTADALIRATPPALYFKKLMVQVKDLVTGAVKQQQLLLNAGNYETRFHGLLPNRNHEVIAWAVNASGDDGAITAATAFTSATNANVPSAPGTAIIGQRQSQEVVYSWGKVTPAAGNPPIVAYILEKQVGAGAFTEIWRGDAQSLVDTAVATGTTYTIRVKVRDGVGNESAYTTSSGYTVQKMIDDSYIIAQGVGGGSIANSAINRNRTNTGTSSGSTSILSNFTTGFALDPYMFFPAIFGDGTQLNLMTFNSDLGSDNGVFGIYNQTAATHTAGYRSRTFLP